MQKPFLVSLNTANLQLNYYNKYIDNSDTTYKTLLHPIICTMCIKTQARFDGFYVDFVLRFLDFFGNLCYNKRVYTM